MAKYKILEAGEGTATHHREVDGEPVHLPLPGFEGFEFFSHYRLETDLMGSWPHYMISEVSSGGLITGDFELEEAKAKALRILNRETPAGLQQKIDSILKRNIVNEEVNKSD